MRNKLTLFIPLILLLALAMVIPVSSFAPPPAQALPAPNCWSIFLSLPSRCE